MKLKIIILIFLSSFLISIRSVLAQTQFDTVNPYKESYVAGETPKITGSSNPSVKIHIYGDMLERFTQSFLNTTFPELKNKNSQVQFIFHHSIYLPWIDNSNKTRLNSECLAKQNQFWPNISNIQNNQDLVNIDQNQFKSCLDNSEVNSYVGSSGDQNMYFSSSSVPTFILQKTGTENAIRINGNQTIDVFASAIKRLTGDNISPQTTSIPAITKSRIGTSVIPTFIPSPLNTQPDLQSQIDELKNQVQETQKQQSYLSQQLEAFKKYITEIFKKLVGTH